MPKVSSQRCCCAAQEASAAELASQADPAGRGVQASATSSLKHGQDARSGAVRHSWCDCAKSMQLCNIGALIHTQPSGSLRALGYCATQISSASADESLGVGRATAVSCLGLARASSMAQQGLDVEVLVRSVDGALPVQWP